MTEPVPLEVYEEGVYLCGTKAVLTPGELLTPNMPSCFRDDAPIRLTTHTLRPAPRIRTRTVAEDIQRGSSTARRRAA